MLPLGRGVCLRTRGKAPRIERVRVWQRKQQQRRSKRRPALLVLLLTSLARPLFLSPQAFSFAKGEHVCLVHTPIVDSARSSEESEGGRSSKRGRSITQQPRGSTVPRSAQAEKQHDDAFGRPGTVVARADLPVPRRRGDQERAAGEGGPLQSRPAPSVGRSSSVIKQKTQG